MCRQGDLARRRLRSVDLAPGRAVEDGGRLRVTGGTRHQRGGEEQANQAGKARALATPTARYPKASSEAPRLARMLARFRAAIPTRGPARCRSNPRSRSKASMNRSWASSRSPFASATLPRFIAAMATPRPLCIRAKRSRASSSIARAPSRSPMLEPHDPGIVVHECLGQRFPDRSASRRASSMRARAGAGPSRPVRVTAREQTFPGLRRHRHRLRTRRHRRHEGVLGQVGSPFEATDVLVHLGQHPPRPGQDDPVDSCCVPRQAPFQHLDAQGLILLEPVQVRAPAMASPPSSTPSPEAACSKATSRLGCSSSSRRSQTDSSAPNSGVSASAAGGHTTTRADPGPVDPGSAGRLQAGSGVLADGLQIAVPGRRPGRVGDEERLVHQGEDGVLDLVVVQVGTRHRHAGSSSKGAANTDRRAKTNCSVSSSRRCDQSMRAVMVC